MSDTATMKIMAELVPVGSRVLDLGCGDGAMLAYLQQVRGCTGYGIEIDDANVLAAVKNGVNVSQSDLEAGLSGFEDASFDHVVLSQTLQAMRHTEAIVFEMLRVGREAVVSFPNFGYWKHRMDILQGHMPVSERLPYQWYDTPNIHLCTIADFDDFCARRNIVVKERRVFDEGRLITEEQNFLGSLAVYRITRG